MLKLNHVFLWGYSEERKSYRLFNLITNKIIVSRDMIFDEGRVYGHKEKNMLKRKN